jgi:AraC-like DNA-binding protein
MEIKAPVTNPEAIIDDVAKLLGVSIHTDGFEKHFKIPDAIGKGFMLEVTFRPGLQLDILDFQFHEDISVNLEGDFSQLDFSCFLSGNCNFQWDSLHGKKPINDYFGQNFISFLPEGRGTTKLSSKQHLRTVSILISPSLLNTFLGYEFDEIPPDLHCIVEGANGNGYCSQMLMTKSMRSTAHEILNCPYQGSIKRMYLESKAMELITHQLAQVVFAETGKKNKLSLLRLDDIERIHEAKDILIRDLENPPSLLELAGQVGTNKNKLNQGFHKMFGSSAFDYLRICRLEWARKLLESEDKSVTEVAFEVGYAQQSSFTTAFKKHFGTNPSDHLR